MPQWGLHLGLFVGRRERREAMSRRGLGLGQSGGRRERREAMPWRRFGPGQSGGRRGRLRRCLGGVLALDKAVAGGDAVR